MKLLDAYPPELSRIGDPRGNFLIRVENEKIIVTHQDPDGKPIDEFSGKTAIEIYRKMANEFRVSDLSHAMDIGCELQKA